MSLNRWAVDKLLLAISIVYCMSSYQLQDNGYPAFTGATLTYIALVSIITLTYGMFGD